MKLYSRGQVALIAAVSAAAALAFGGAILLLLLHFGLFSARVSRDQVALNGTAVAAPSGSGSQGYRLGSAPFSAEEASNIDVYQRLNAGVVNVSTETVSLNWFLEPVPEGGGVGSGSIIDKQGYVLTNFHVIDKAYRVTITLSDGSQYPGKVIGSDPESDLAVIKFDPGSHDLVTVPLGTADNLRVGQRVLAIGNPFGLSRTLTTGIVSGLGRPIKTESGLIMRDMIQTDASINPGNSGGPLLDSNGMMVGINTMIFSPSGGSVGIGFATPVDTAKRIIPELIKFGLVRRGWIDVVPVQIDNNIVRYAELPVGKGLLISKVVRGGNADVAGLHGGDPQNPVRYGQSVIYFGGDIIVAVNGLQVSSIGDLFAALEGTVPGQRVPVDVLRSGRRMSFHLTLDERPQGLLWE